jgi:5-methylcytosine-specific restriction protein A
VELEETQSMPSPEGKVFFLVSVDPKDLRKEKEKARELRRTQWWQRQVARGRCHYCERTFHFAELTMDHIVPLIRGGRSTRGNIVPACKECNNRKKYLLPIEWEDYMSRLKGSACPEGEGSLSKSEGQGKENGRV